MTTKEIMDRLNLKNEIHWTYSVKGVRIDATIKQYQTEWELRGVASNGEYCSPYLLDSDELREFVKTHRVQISKGLKVD